jgi:hypothetical protein
VALHLQRCGTCGQPHTPFNPEAQMQLQLQHLLLLQGHGCSCHRVVQVLCLVWA